MRLDCGCSSLVSNQVQQWGGSTCGAGFRLDRRADKNSTRQQQECEAAAAAGGRGPAWPVQNQRCSSHLFGSSSTPSPEPRLDPQPPMAGPRGPTSSLLLLDEEEDEEEELVPSPSFFSLSPSLLLDLCFFFFDFPSFPSDLSPSFLFLSFLSLFSSLSLSFLSLSLSR